MHLAGVLPVPAGCESGRVFPVLTVALDNELRFISVVACNVEHPMVSSTASVEPLPLTGHSFTRSDSIASSLSSAGEGSGAVLKRRSRTRTRSLASAKRGRSLGPQAGSSKYESDAGESFLDLDDAPPLPSQSPTAVLHAEPEEMTPTEKHNLKKSRRRSRTIGPESRPTFKGLEAEMPQFARSWSALDVRDPPPEQSRGRQAKSDNGSVKGVRASCACSGGGMLTPCSNEGEAAWSQSPSSILPTKLSLRLLVTAQPTDPVRVRRGPSCPDSGSFCTERARLNFDAALVDVVVCLSCVDIRRHPNRVVHALHRQRRRGGRVVSGDCHS